MAVIDAPSERLPDEPFHHDVWAADVRAGLDDIRDGGMIDELYDLEPRKNVSADIPDVSTERYAIFIAARFIVLAWVTECTLDMPPRPSSSTTRHAPTCEPTAGASSGRPRRRA